MFPAAKASAPNAKTTEEVATNSKCSASEDVGIEQARIPRTEPKIATTTEQSTENVSFLIAPKLVVQKPQRRGKGMGISHTESILMLREVCSQKAYIAPQVCKSKRFENVADSLNCNTDFEVKVDFKNVQERYEWMQKPFDGDNKKHAQLSGVGGGVPEEVELLSSMREGRTEMALNINLGKDEIKERVQCKIASGERLVANSIMDSTQ